MASKPPAKPSRAATRASGQGAGSTKRPASSMRSEAASALREAKRREREAAKSAANSLRSRRPEPADEGAVVCPFTPEELAEWRRLLLRHRQEISSDISHLERDAFEAENGHIAPNHMAERGSDAEIQDLSLSIADNEHAVLWQIDRALQKIDTGRPLPFGICEYTKRPIPKSRLQLIPWTPLSIEGMHYVEENGLAIEDVLVDG